MKFALKGKAKKDGGHGDKSNTRAKPTIKDNIGRKPMFGSDSESEDEQDRFKKLVAAKTAKVTKEVNDMGEPKVEIDRTENVPVESTERKLKYLDQLLESNRKRKQEQLVAQSNIDTGDSYVFESEAYKAKKQKISVEEEEEDEESGSFYAKVLDAKMGIVTETRAPKEVPNEPAVIPEQPTKQSTKQKANPTVQHTTLSTNALSILTNLIASKVTKDELARYREEYHTRQEIN